MLENNMSAKYEMIISWSKEDGCFVAEVPELPGCMGDGKTYKDVVASTKVIIQEWIETAYQLGKSIPQPRGRLMYV